jgi:hypothetical protein
VTAPSEKLSISNGHTMRDFQDWNMQMRDQRWKEEKSDSTPANAEAAQLHDSTRTERQPAAQGSTPSDTVWPRSRRAPHTERSSR